MRPRASLCSQGSGSVVLSGLIVNISFCYSFVKSKHNRVFTQNTGIPSRLQLRVFFSWDLDIETQGGVLTAIRSFRVKMGMGRREKEGKGVGEGGCG